VQLPLWNFVSSVVDFFRSLRNHRKKYAVRASHPNRILQLEFNVYPLTPQRACLIRALRQLRPAHRVAVVV
jgi:hypothetical protein